ncbi:MAG: pyrroloquinoline quinone-dependent dehydrogenase [Pseudomonadota bacterium]
MPQLRIRTYTCHLCAALMLLCAGQITLAHDSDWPTYGNSAKTHKYVNLNQINASNVARVSLAWRWDSPDNAIATSNPRLTPWGFKSTPLKVGNRLFISTSLGHVASIDAQTGKSLWVFDTRTYADGRPTNLGFNHRGVAYWRAGSEERILMPTNNAYLWALDAKTGKPIQTFGDAGRVDLTLGLGRPVARKHYSVISAPVVVGDILVVGSSIMDGPPNKEMPPGHVRGFNIKTGAQAWIFHTIPQAGEFGTHTWHNESWRYSGNTNVWTGMSADLELGYVYVPTGTPTNDWYGGHRLGDNLFAESLLCLDAQTGKRIWHFQMIHHGLWDYDLPAAPTLIDIEVDGTPIKAVAQVSKQGFVYVFDRVTGKPVWPIEERPVPPSTVPGEVASLTQPIPTRPAPFERQGMSKDMLIDFSPQLRRAAEETLAQFDYGPLYTPPTLRGTIQMPGWAGGANWSGAAFDPSRQWLYIPSTASPIVVQIKQANPDETNFAYVRSRAVTRVRGPEGLPLIKPPYGQITAIDMRTGEHVWAVPRGDGPRQKVIDLGLPDPGPLGGWGTGPVLTRDLLWLGMSEGEQHWLRAYDKVTGEVRGAVALPLPPQGTPMSYMADGRQYLAVAAGQGRTAALLGIALPSGAAQAQKPSAR